MLWASLDVDLIDDPTFLELLQDDPSNMCRFLRLIQVAKNAQSGGQIILTDGRPCNAKLLALVHHESTDTWETFLETCIGLQLISWNAEYLCYEIVDWRRWHRSPSDSKDAVKYRVGKFRAKLKNETKRNEPVTKKKRPVTACNDITVTVTETVTETETVTSIPLPPAGEDGRTDLLDLSEGVDGDDSGGTPPEPPSPPNVDPLDAYRSCAALVAPGPIKAKDVELFDDLTAAQQAGGFTNEEVSEALHYGVSATKWALEHGPKPIKMPRAYMVEAAKNVLERIQDRNIDRRASKRDGFRDPGPVAWRPPENSSNGLVAAGGT